MGDTDLDDATHVDRHVEQTAAIETVPISTPARSAGSMSAKRDEVVRPIVAGYDVGALIGRGGMGVVWEALEHRLERVVALKVHAGTTGSGSSQGTDDPLEPTKQLWSEARLAAKIAHPGVVPVHDVGRTLDGRPYYTMELVRGSSLRSVLKDGIDQARALSIAASIADAVAAAHKVGIVHCDLKPANVLIDEEGRVKILDFGLAELLSTKRDRWEVRGSPAYMSPEQVLAQSPTAATDVHGIGAMLFEMLTGRLPYPGTSGDDMMLAVATLPPPSATELNPAVGSELERLVGKCLAKKPEERYPSAVALAAALRAIVEGRPIDSAPPPKPYAPKSAALEVVPSAGFRRADAKLHYRWSWTFDAPPAVVWPYVANTDRFNKAIGLPSVDYTDQKDDGAWSRIGSFRVLGLDIAWDEPPFEWVKNREHSVTRVYRFGPLKAFWNRVSLRALEGGKTELVHEIWVIPNGLFGRLAALFEIQIKAGRRMDKVYRRLGESIRTGASTGLSIPPPALDYFERASSPSAKQREIVEHGTRHLANDRGFRRELLEKLSRLLLESPDKRIERIKPFSIAAEWGEPREEVLDLFVHAASAGLVDIAWDLICPECQVPHEAAATLKRVVRDGSCTACGTTYERDLARSVELIFRPHASLRRVEPKTYCAGAPALRPHVYAQQTLEPGETRSFRIDLPRGDYRIAATRAGRAWEFSASYSGVAAACSMRVDEKAIDAKPLVVRAGEVEVTIENATGRSEIVRLEVSGAGRDDVTAAIAMAHPTFRELFSEELLAQGEHLSVSRMAFLFADVVNRADLLEELGDPAAFGLLSTLESGVRGAVHEHQGSVVEVDASGTLLAAFPTSAQAAAAGLAALERAASSAPRARVRASVHEGRCIALSRGHAIQYFGETLNRGVALLAESDPGSLAVSNAVESDAAAAKVLFAPSIARAVRTHGSGRYAGRRFTQVRPTR